MSNPARAPKIASEVQGDLNRFDTDARFDDCEKWKQAVRANKHLPVAQRILEPLDMEVHKTIMLRAHETLDPRVQSMGVAVATAAEGALTFRTRSVYGKEMTNEGFALLPEGGACGKNEVRSRMKDTVMADFGPIGTLGRLAKAYPKAGAPPPSYPVTREEAKRALKRLGYTGMDKDLAPLPFAKMGPDSEAITVNPKSDNGFPVLMKWETEGAPEMCMKNVKRLEKELDGSSTVWDKIRELEVTNPEFVALRGKGKADYYKSEKLRNVMGRFYNAFPRHIAMYMQQATQVFEGHCVHIGANAESRTFSGLTLVRGGAKALIEAMDANLQEDGYAYTHMGDDSFVVIRMGGKLYLFALDCSNFDLTQHADVTEEIHKVIRDELKRIHEKAGELWYAYARERLVVVTGSLVRKFKHAGPSGMPLQSKVNDMLMDVMISRLVERVRASDLEDEAALGRLVEEIGSGMGFNVRLEQYAAVNATTIHDALKVNPFLYVGYYFHVRDDEVVVHCDVPRTMAQIPYPGLKWVKTTEELLTNEAMRLGSIAQNLGIPTLELEPAFKAMRSYALRLVERALIEGKDIESSRLIWAVSDNPLGASPVPSLKGLLAVLQRDPRVLWLGELETTDELIFDWAEEAEMEDAVRSWQGRKPALAAVGRVGRLEVRPVPTHPVTSRNDGRPPPTAVWGPPKPKRVNRVALERLREGRAERHRFRFTTRSPSPESGTDWSDSGDDAYDDDHWH